jgi:hypothetical protein
MIIINGKRWRVQLVPPSHPYLLTHNLTTAFGCCDNVKKTIYINNTLSAEMIKKVLCHEIVHASMTSYKVKLNHRDEELVADIISTYGEEIIELTNSTYSTFKFM